ncbi:undecaprenyl-diphosphatase [Archangium gephyra]|uniref:Undecaprenyl-diphosphatase n=1 Tax=Archangium gephyra TaxID=48 RepID=A0AAC8QHR9_9BACT|nr:undecaprenyl-diphosphate phosphatase [Archangium gephyra]AKJ07569.1 Undecaprenyl-diphosphatase [Archangium gephyra]REG29329.1 undecaprenyl-diphosphatase [Archangium gephyra]
MSLLQAIVLGLVQGLTEFLPISSTAHLRIVPELFGWPDPGAAYSAVIQLGTVAAVLIYFRHDIVTLLRAFFQGLVRRQPFATTESRLAWFVLIGTLPIGICGLAFKKTIEGSLRSLYVISGSLIVLALILFVVERMASHKRTLDDMRWRDGLIVGLWQALALIPGSSRSGTTITGALSLGLRREDAARYSFLLSIPATSLAGIFELKHLLEATERPSTMALVTGTLVAFASGWAAIAWLLSYLRKRSTLIFIVYRVVLGVVLLVLLNQGFLRPMSGVENVDTSNKPLKVPVERQGTD